jgi:uncharacterized membrane protein
MNKQRLEAFSDGIFAIAITLLILNVTIPSVDYDGLSAALWALLPKILSYIMSFLLIGLYWLRHHFYLDKVRKIDATLALINIILLLLVSFIPFFTSLLGLYPNKQLPLILYGLGLLTTNSMAFLMLMYISRGRYLVHESAKNDLFRTHFPIFLIINGIYIVAICLSHVWPVLSYFLYLINLILEIRIYVRRINSAVK